MNWFINLYTLHPYTATTITVLFVSTAVGTMPSPTSKTGFYRWFFDFIHAFTGGLFRVLGNRAALSNGNGNGNGTNPEWKPDFTKGAGK